MALDGFPSATDSLGPCGSLGYQSLLNSIDTVQMQLQPKETSYAWLIIKEWLWIALHFTQAICKQTKARQSQLALHDPDLQLNRNPGVDLDP